MIQFRMAKRGFLLGLILLAGAGCQGMSKTAQGGLIGAGTGAGLGAIAGSATGNSGVGAAIGAGIGTVLGGAIGNDMDQQDRRALENRVVQAEAVAAAQPSSTVGIMDVIQMSRDGVPEDVIINQIRTTNSRFLLSNEDLRTLTANNVPRAVIIEMQNRKPGRTTTVIREQPQVIYRESAPVIVYERWAPPPPPPRFGWGVGVHWAR